MMVLFNFESTKNANIFKGFYSDLKGKLMEKLPVALNKFNNNPTKQYYMNTEKSCHNFELCNATLETMRKILGCLDSLKATGLDGISWKFLKDGAEVLALPLCNLVNLSIKQSLFPDQCKIAKLKPLFKKGSKSDPTNYRPISLLPAVSKIIEKTIQIQTQENLDKNDLLYKYQSGFRANFSTDSCLAQLTDFMLRRVDKGFHTEMVLVDLQKAFDTLDYTVLLQKTECMGFKESFIKCFRLYL